MWEPRGFLEVLWGRCWTCFPHTPLWWSESAHLQRTRQAAQGCRETDAHSRHHCSLFGRLSCLPPGTRKPPVSSTNIDWLDISDTKQIIARWERNRSQPEPCQILHTFGSYWALQGLLCICRSRAAWRTVVTTCQLSYGDRTLGGYGLETCSPLDLGESANLYSLSHWCRAFHLMLFSHSFIWGQVPWRFVQSKLREQVEISVSTNFWYLEIRVKQLKWLVCIFSCGWSTGTMLVSYAFSQSLNTVDWETNSNHSMKFCTSRSSHSCKHHWMHRFGVAVCLFNHNLNTTQRAKKPLQGISPV